MKHLAVIQTEFLKQARDWDDLSLEDQKGYLKRHPKSKRKLTAKPEHPSKSEPKPSSTHQKVEKKKQTLTQTLSETPKLDKKLLHLLKTLPDRRDIEFREKLKETLSETPKLDKKLSNIFAVYSTVGKDWNEKDSADAKKLDKVWSKEFPDEKEVTAADVIYGVNHSMGLHKALGEKKPKRTKPLTEQEFIQAAKDEFLTNSGRLPKVEGEDDPSTTVMKTYGLKEPLTSSEASSLKQIESELPTDQKKFAKYLVSNNKRETKRSIEDASNEERPIIKSEREGDEARYEVPTTTRFAAPARAWFNSGVGGIEFASFKTLDEAKAFIDKAPELEKKAILRREIEKVGDDIRKSYESSFADVDDRLSTSNASWLGEVMSKYPREDQYGVNIKDNKEVSRYVSKKGRNFNLTPEQQLNISRAISSPASSTKEQLEKAVNEIDLFTKDIEANKDLFEGYQSEYADSFIKNKDKLKAVIEKQIPKVDLKNKLMDQHGYEKSKDDLKLPEGFKFKDKASFGETYDKDQIVIGNTDDTMEMVVDLGKPGHYGKYGGEVYYKVPGQKGTYTIGARGIDSGLSVDWNDDRSFTDVVKDKEQEVRKKQETISRSISVPLMGNSWKVTPEGIEKIKAELQSGKSHTFAPHGMGTAYSVSTRPTDRYSKRVSPETEAVLGMSPLYASSIDWD